MKYFFMNIFARIFDAFLKRDLQGIPVLLYHAIGNENSSLFVKKEDFEKQMWFLSKNGFTSILPHDIETGFSRRKVFLITFDDGYKSVYEIALPILKKYGFKAAVFVSTGNIGGKSIWAKSGDDDKNHALLSLEEIKELKQFGWCVGNHFFSHKNLIEVPEDKVPEEYKTSCEILEKNNIHENKNIIAYPFNRYNNNVIEILKKEGVKIAFAGGNELYSKYDDLLAIPRIQIDNNFLRFKLYFSNSFNQIKSIFG